MPILCFECPRLNDSYLFYAIDNDNKAVSARTDLSIYEKVNSTFCRKALIEFKALNPVIENYEKDFCKLKNEDESLIKYFIQIIKNYDNGTIKSLRDKIKIKVIT